MVRKTIASLALGFSIGVGGAYMGEKLGYIHHGRKPASISYLESKHNEIIHILNLEYSQFADKNYGNCTFEILGIPRKKMKLTLVCGERLVMPHIETSTFSSGTFRTRITGIVIQNQTFLPGNCIRVENEVVEGTSCRK